MEKIQPDWTLIHRADTLGSGAAVHRVQNFIRSYQSVVELYNQTLDDELLPEVSEAEVRLRRLVYHEEARIALQGY